MVELKTTLGEQPVGAEGGSTVRVEGGSTVELYHTQDLACFH